MNYFIFVFAFTLWTLLQHISYIPIRVKDVFRSVVNSDKITPMNNKDVWSKGNDNQWIK